MENLSEAMLLDFDGWHAKQDQQTQDSITAHLNAMPEADRPAAKLKLGAQVAISEHSGIDLDTVGDRWDTIRAGYAEEKGGDWGAVKNDEPAFYAKMVAQAQAGRDERQLIFGPEAPVAPLTTGQKWSKLLIPKYGVGQLPSVTQHDQEQSDHDKAVQSSLSYRAQEAAYAGRPYADALGEWQVENGGKPGYDPERAGTYADVARATHGQIAEALTKVRPIARQAFTAMAKSQMGMDDEGGDAAPFALFRGLSQDEKRLAFRLMTDEASGAGKDKGQAKAFGQAIERGFGNLLAGASVAEFRSEMLRTSFAEGDRVTRKTPEEEVLANRMTHSAMVDDGELALGHAVESRGGRALSAEEAAQWNQRLAGSLEDLDTGEQLRKFGQEIIDPTNKAGGLFFQRVVLPVADSAALMGAMSIPGGWAPALHVTAAGYQNDEYMRLRDLGMTPGEANKLAAITGLGQAALDRAEFGVLSKGLPGTTRALEQLALGGSAVERFAINSAATTAGETVIELLQDHIVPAIVQDNLASDPAFDLAWADVWAETAAAAPETALGMLLLSGGGGLWQTHEQSRTVRDLASSGAAMRLRGYSMEQIAEIQAAPSGAQGELLARYLPTEAPTGEAAAALVKEAVAMAQKEQATFTARQSAETAATSEAADYAIRVTRNSRGWLITKPDGKVVTVDTAEAARRIREDLRQAGSQQEAEALVQIVDAWHDKAPDGTRRETNLTGETVRSDGETITHTRDGEVTREITSGADLAALREEARMDAKAGGSEAIDVLVNGQNEVEFKQRVADGARETLQRLTLNQSESTALTAIHEQVEAVWRTGIANGTITMDETRAAVRSVAAALDPSQARDKQERAFRERVQRVADGTATDTEMRETISELAVAEVVGRRKDGTTMPAGSISAALDAALSSASDAGEVAALGKFRAWLRAVRQYMRGVFGTVAALKKSKREGGALHWEQMVNKLLGLDEQAAYDKALADEMALAAGEDYTEPTPEEMEAGVAFSLSPSTPERDARPLDIVKIPSMELSGERSDWRRSVRDFIATNLQGQALENHDTGWRIRFNAESKAESTSKLRREPQFRAAMQVVPIVENAVLLGDSAPAKGREGDTERFHYFAVPVEINGHSADVWFNTRTQLHSGESIFYEFGLKENAIHATQGLKAESSPDAPQHGPQLTVGDYIAKVKGTLPAAIKVESSPAFSLSAGDRVAIVQKQLDAALARDPARRRELERAAQHRLQALQFDWETTRWTGRGDEIKPIVEQRSAASLNKEQAVRYAFRAEELANEGLSKLHLSAQAALGEGLQKLDDRPLIHAMLNDHGRLMSQSEAAKLGRFGEYDGVPWLPPKWYGGTIMPDEMAQDLYDAGLIHEPSPDALWGALYSEIKSVRDANDKFKEALAAVKAIEKQARNTAHEEAAEWRRKQDEQQKKDWNPRAALLRDMRTLDALTSVFPAEVRARVGGMIKLAQLGTVEARAKEIERRIARLSGLLETHLQAESRERIEELFDRARPEMKPGEKPKGAMTPDAHRLTQLAEEFSRIPEDRVEGERVNIANANDVPGADLGSLAERQQVLELFGGMEAMNAQQLDAAATWLEGVIETGRNEWAMIQEARIEEWNVRARELRGDTGATGDVANLQRDIAQERTMRRELGGWGFALISFEQTMNAIFGRESAVGQSLVERVRAATHQRTDSIRNKRAVWRDAMREIFRGPWHEVQEALWEHAQVDGRLSITANRMAGRVARTEAIPVEIAQRLVAGTDAMRRTLGFTEAEVAQMEVLLEENAGLDRPRVNLNLERFTGGTATPTPMSQLQAVNLVMLSRQADYRDTLPFHGWTPESILDIENRLTPQARQIMRWLSVQYRDGYASINNVFQQMYGAPLPQIANYSPGSFESMRPGKAPSPEDGGAAGAGGLSPGALKTRRKHKAAPRLVDALSAYWGHEGQMEHFKAFAEVTRELNSVILRPGSRDSIQERAGSDGLSALQDWVKIFESDGVQASTAQTRLDKLNTRLQSAVATTALAWNVGTMVKQSLAVLNPAYEMPAGDYLRGFSRLLRGELDFREIWGSEMIRRRVEAGASPELRQVMAGLAGQHPGGTLTRRPRELVQLGMDLLGDADGFFTAAGAAIHYDWAKREAMASGMDETQAKAAAMRRTQGMVDRTSQPVESMNRSLYEARNQTNPSSRWLFMFASEARQKAALYIEALSAVTHGRGTRQDATVLAISHVIVPLIMQTMVNILRDARDDDDDSLFDPKHWSPKDYLKAMALGPLSGFPLLGGIADSIVSVALGRPSMQSDPTNPLNGVKQIIPALESMADENESEPFEKGVGAAVAAGNVTAIASAFHPAAQSVQWVGSAANAIKQAFQWGDNFLPDTGSEREKKDRAASNRERKQR